MNSVLALPTLYRLEKDPVLISDNMLGLLDRIPAKTVIIFSYHSVMIGLEFKKSFRKHVWLTHTVQSSTLSLFFLTILFSTSAVSHGVPEQLKVKLAIHALKVWPL